MPPTLTDLAHEAFSALDKALVVWPEVVVRPAVPILYFGDEPAYRQSSLKIITVGLNPSLAEFPHHDPFLRFPKAEGQGPGALYLESLNDYYREVPYDRWFNTFRGLLHGLHASFHGDQPNVALHTDLGSPVATNPTWSKLPGGVRTELGSLGTPLWHDLVRELRPDVILASVAKARLREIQFEPVDEWQSVHVATTPNPYRVQAHRVRITPDHTALLVWGQAAQTPVRHRLLRRQTHHCRLDQEGSSCLTPAMSSSSPIPAGNVSLRIQHRAVPCHGTPAITAASSC